jgi:ubiquinone/menaquinone biosynthesis C-methylase UbiE
MASEDHEIKIQRHHYAEIAHEYNGRHVFLEDEHYFALSFLMAFINSLSITSILDIGSGTGRALLHIRKHTPNLKVMGIEPVKELREIGYTNGLSRNELIEGDGTDLIFNDGSFDLVCEFGMLHHIRYPEKVVLEMLRVAKRAIFISDSNNFGQGGLFNRTFKQILNALGLWKVAIFFKTRGKGYTYHPDGDGLAYSYSVFNNYVLIRQQCQKVHILNTRDGAINPYRSAGHVALLGIKK